MSDDPRDPLSDFFAAEREQVQPLPADEVRWRRIRTEARTRRGPRWPYAVAAAVVLLLAAGSGLVTASRHASTTAAARPTVTRTVWVRASGTTLDDATRATTAAGSPTTGTAATSSGTSSGTPPGTASAPVPADFRVVSVSTVASGRLFALGSASCAGRPCALVATSGDRGATWSLRGQVPGVTVAARTVAHQPTRLGSPTTVTDVRFADDGVGWAYGATVRRTTDGGATWQDYPHGSGAVVDLATDGTTVVLTSTDSCTGLVCSGAIEALRAGTGDVGASRVVGRVSAGQTLVGADVLWLGGTAYVAPRGSEAVPPQSLGARGVGPVRATSAPPCPVGQGLLQAFAPASGTSLLALCPPQGAAGSLVSSVVRSDDAGASWSLVPGRGVSLTNSGTVSVAASDATHLTAVSGGSAALHGSLVVSADGGATWAAPAAAPPVPTGGWAWVGSPGGRTFYALPSDPTGGFWRSDDDGATWRAVVVAR